VRFSARQLDIGLACGKRRAALIRCNRSKLKIHTPQINSGVHK
jgi:hypothetical protein